VAKQRAGARVLRACPHPQRCRIHVEASINHGIHSGLRQAATATAAAAGEGRAVGVVAWRNAKQRRKWAPSSNESFLGCRRQLLRFFYSLDSLLKSKKGGRGRSGCHHGTACTCATEAQYQCTLHTMIIEPLRRRASPLAAAAAPRRAFSSPR
jgi:hypothetical protein